MAQKQFKVRYYCRRCGKTSTTKYKNSSSAPARCQHCGSSYTDKTGIAKTRVKK